MSDHIERACHECGSLLHHESKCPQRAVTTNDSTHDAQTVLCRDHENCGFAEGDRDYRTKCTVCGATPTVHPTGLCGPCCFGEAETINGNW